MSESQWKSSYDDDQGDRFAKVKLILARIFGDGENPLAWGFTLFSFNGIRVRIHLLFIVYLLTELIFTLPGNREGFVFVWPRLVAMITLVMLHEIGHCVMCRRVGGKAHEIMLWPLGGLAMCDIPDDWKSELKVALAGPMVNLILVPIFAVPLYILTGTLSSLAFNPLGMGSNATVLTLVSGETTWWLIALGGFYSINMILLVFNLLIPMYPLDGARALQAILWKRSSQNKSMWTTTNVGLGVAIVLGIIGFVFEDASILVAIAIFGGLVCSMQRRRLQFLRYGEMTPGISGDGSSEAWKKASIVDEDDQEVISQAELDRILAKISISGIESLSRKERRSLKRATETSRKTQ